MDKSEGTSMWKSLRRQLARWNIGIRGVTVVTVLVVVALYMVSRQLAAPGTVYVTAYMRSFSPAVVQVNSSTTSSLSATATNLNPPPPTPDEGSLSTIYNWSVSSVEYKAKQANTFGTPPSNSYTASISPAQPSTSSGATLTFTPNIAGYWEVSTTCGVTVTDTNNNQLTWGGSSYGGPKNLASCILHIKYGGLGTQVDNQTENVCVGMYIPLVAEYSPSDMTLQWTVPGSIISAYEADDNTATIIPVTDADMTYASLNYFWMDTDSGSTTNEKVTLTGTLPTGDSSTVSTTFNVCRPTPTFTASYPALISLENGALYDGDGSSWANVGILFKCNVSSSSFGDESNLWSAQIATSLVVKTEQYDVSSNTTQEFAFGLPSATLLPGPLIDTSFPYESSDASGTDYRDIIMNNQIIREIEDAPNYSVDPPIKGYGFGPGIWETYNVVVTENFVHNLLFLPSPSAGGVENYAPLSQIGWGWSAEADNWNNDGFYLNNPTKIPTSQPQASELSTLPEWNNNAKNPTWGWSNPDWYMVP